MVSAPETFTSDGASSTLRALTLPSTTYADHLHQNNRYTFEYMCCVKAMFYVRFYDRQIRFYSGGERVGG
jgi:hypothetical protein